MVCGYDTYHDARQRKAVGAFVASFNQNFTRYVSSVQIHENNEEISPSFQTHMLKCLRYASYYIVDVYSTNNCSLVFFADIIAMLTARFRTKSSSIEME
jgi:hypothetical protein